MIKPNPHQFISLLFWLRLERLAKDGVGYRFPVPAIPVPYAPQDAQGCEDKYRPTKIEELQCTFLLEGFE